jgi:hypothetical protein
LLLEMAPEAKIGVAGNEHFLVDRSVRVMTGRASLPYCLMLEHKRPALRSVAFAARVVLS